MGKTPADSDPDLPIPWCLRNLDPSTLKGTLTAFPEALEGPLTSVPDALEGLEGLEATQPQKKTRPPRRVFFYKEPDFTSAPS